MIHSVTLDSRTYRVWVINGSIVGIADSAATFAVFHGLGRYSPSFVRRIASLLP
jgi:hypothetical protein